MWTVADWLDNERVLWNWTAACCVCVFGLRYSGGTGCPSGERLCDPWHREQSGGGDPLPSGGRERPVWKRFPSRSIHHGPEESRAGRAKVSRVVQIRTWCANWLIGWRCVWWHWKSGGCLLLCAEMFLIYSGVQSQMIQIVLWLFTLKIV